jgi:hypothetical protein
MAETIPVTTRQLESLIRLAQARAKAELREVVEAADAFDVIEIVREGAFGGDALNGLDMSFGDGGLGQRRGVFGGGGGGAGGGSGKPTMKKIKALVTRLNRDADAKGVAHYPCFCKRPPHFRPPNFVVSHLFVLFDRAAVLFFPSFVATFSAGRVSVFMPPPTPPSLLNTGVAVSILGVIFVFTHTQPRSTGSALFTYAELEETSQAMGLQV